MNDTKVVQVVTFSGTITNYGQPVSWSDNNDLAFCTLECINIVEPLVYSFNTDSSSPIAIHRDFIEAPTQVNQFDFGINRNELHLTLPRDEMYRFMLDRTLSPAVPCTPAYKGYVEAAWSPVGIGLCGTCALAALTKDHRLTIFTKQAKKWISVAEPSQLFYEYLQSRKYEMPWITNTCSPGYQTPALQDLQMKSYATAAVKITWSHLMSCNIEEPSSSTGGSGEWSENFSLLICGMKNGCVVLWKVGTSMKSSDDMVLEKIFDTNIGIISALTWVEVAANFGFLLIGSSNGKISMYSVTSEQQSGIIVELLNSLWTDSDGLRVSHISCFRESNQLLYIVAAKNNFIFAWELYSMKVMNATYKMGNFVQPITGIFSDNGAFIASTGDGMLVEIALGKDENGFWITCGEILDDIRDNDMTYAGLCGSPNRLLFCIVQNIASFYDHLAVREPLKLLIIKHKSVEESIALIWALCETRITFSNFTDILQYLYYCWLENRQLPDVLLPVLDLSVEQLRMQALPKLQLLRWLHRLIIFGEQNDNKVVLCKAQMEVINSILIEYQLLALLRKISIGHHALEDGIDWIHVLSIICQWFSNYINELHPKDQKLIIHLLNKIHSKPGFQNQGVSAELCKLCNNIIPLDNINFGKCPNGHTFGRCSLSLQLCDKPAYKKCINCSVLADDNICKFLQTARCPFCSRMFD